MCGQLTWHHKKIPSAIVLTLGNKVVLCIYCVCNYDVLHEQVINVLLCHSPFCSLAYVGHIYAFHTHTQTLTRLHALTNLSLLHANSNNFFHSYYKD